MQLCGWASNNSINICVSLRPHVDFTDTFPSELRINLHELIESDIHVLANEMFRNHPNFARVRDVYSVLVREVVRLMEGVFLWARLILKSLLREVGLHSTHDLLLEKIRSLPREMDTLYERILAGMDDSDRRRIDFMLNLVRTNPYPQPMNAFFLAWLDDMAHPAFPSDEHLSRITSLKDLIHVLEAIERQVPGLTKGLLVLSRARFPPPWNTYFFGYHISFFHRTVHDFLDTAPRQNTSGRPFPALTSATSTVGEALPSWPSSVVRGGLLAESPFTSSRDTARIVLGPDRSFRQLPSEAIMVMDVNFHRSHWATFLPILADSGGPILRSPFYITRQH